MISAHWQKQHAHFGKIIWGVSLAISILVITLMLLLDFSIEVVGIFFILIFALLRISLAYIFKDRYGNTMVRVLKYDYEELERPFRMIFKDKNIRFYRNTEDDAYSYDFPGHSLTMTVQPHWVQLEQGAKPHAKVTLHELSAKNEKFADMLSKAIDEIANQPSNKKV
ncbi:MAG: hypothetical protein AB8G95_26720 [Anaerolineae bacterium]